MDVIAKSKIVPMPSDLYDPLWAEFNRQNPRMLKSLGAAASENGEGGTEEEKAAAAAAAEEAKKQADAEAARKAAEEANKGKSSEELLALVQKLEDEKAKLLKDTMKNKAGKKTAEEALEALRASLKDTIGDDLNLEEVKKALEAKKTAEEDALKKAGDFEALKGRMAAEHQKAIDALNGKLGSATKELQTKLDSAESEIRRLLVTNSFASSKFLTEELLLTPAKAEKLYGDSFKVEEKEGRRAVVAYLGGEPLAGADGKPLSFEDAFKEIVNRDPERETIIRPKARPGAGSGNENRGGTDLPKTPLKGVEAIRAGLAAKNKK